MLSQINQDLGREPMPVLDPSKRGAADSSFVAPYTDALAGMGDFYKRKRRIFYDTDMINENQEEVVRLCPDCAGYMTIFSSAQRGYGILNSAFCVSIPRGACSSCRDDAGEEYAEHLDDRRIGYVLMQDKHKDKFKFYTNMTRTERGY